MKRKVFLIILSIILLLIISGCDIGHIQDTNGAYDYTVETITDDEISENKIKNVCFGLVESNFNGTGKIGAKKLSGVYQVSTKTVTNKTLVYKIESEVVEGNLRIVIISDFSNQIYDVPINTKEEVIIENASGKYMLRIAGESAKFMINYNVEERK